MIDCSAWYLVDPAARSDRYRLAGTVTVDGQPAQKRILVLDRISMKLLAATYSNPNTGAWELAGLQEYPEQSLLVLALDDSGTYNVEAADYISQVTGD